MSGLGNEGDAEDPGSRSTRNELSGTVGGFALQIGHVSGDVTAHGPSSAPTADIPHEVPSVGPGFVDRARERARARDLFGDPAAGGPVRIAVFTGLPGVGKTAVARCVVGESAGAYSGGELYVDFTRLRTEGAGCVSDGLADCLRALGVHDKVMPSTLAGRANLYRTRTASTPMLVVLDDVAEPAEVAPFVPKAPGSAVLVTSHRRLPELLLDDAEIVPIEPLSDATSLELLTARCGTRRFEAEPEAMRELAGLCGGLPIALGVAAAELRTHPSLRVADLVAEIAAADSESGDRASGDSGLGAFGIPDDVVAVLTASYRGLPPEAARLYRKLGLLPGPDFTADLVASVDDGSPGARRSLGSLVASNLVTDDGSGRYRLHGLVRRHARQCAEEESDAWRSGVREQVLRYYLHHGASADLAIMGAGRLRITSHAELSSGTPDAFDGDDAKVRALNWLDAERGNLMAVLRMAVDHGWNRQAWQLAEAMTALYVNRRYLEDWVESTRLGVAAAELDEASDAVVRLRSFVSRPFADLGDLTRARAELDGALPMARRCGNPRLEASVWELFGRYHDERARTGNSDDERGSAVAAYRRALDLFAEADDKRGRAFTMYFLGCSEADGPNPSRALETLRQALALIREVPDQRMAGRALAAIGSTHARLGERTDAVGALTEAIETLAAGEDTYYEAQAREALAEVAGSLGDRGMQRENLRRAWEVHRTFGSPRVEELRSALARVS